MSRDNHPVCPVARAGSLDNRWRKWLQNPRGILQPYIQDGMTVLDLGCGPGFFSLELARMVGKTGRVIASDVQEGMLQKLREKIQGTELGDRITLHRCEASKIGLAEEVDFVLAFYMVHEVPSQEAFFNEIKTIVGASGRILVVEPPFHVSRAAFADMIRKAEDVGLQVVEKPRVLLSKAVLMKRS